MRKLMVCGILTAFLGRAAGGAMSDTERAYLIDQLEQSRKAVLASIASLTDAQWTFKPAPTVWSVQECAEHIVLAESFIFDASQQLLKTPAVDRPENSNSGVDHALVAGAQDRSRKFTAPDAIVPSRKFTTPADAAKAFTAVREKTIGYVQSTQDDLLAAHSARHNAQILEVEAHPAYPKP